MHDADYVWKTIWAQLLSFILREWLLWECRSDDFSKLQDDYFSWKVRISTLDTLFAFNVSHDLDEVIDSDPLHISIHLLLHTMLTVFMCFKELAVEDDVLVHVAHVIVFIDEGWSLEESFFLILTIKAWSDWLVKFTPVVLLEWSLFGSWHCIVCWACEYD